MKQFLEKKMQDETFILHLVTINLTHPDHSQDATWVQAAGGNRDHLLWCSWPLWAESKGAPWHLLRGTEATFPSPGTRDVSEG